MDIFLSFEQGSSTDAHWLRRELLAAGHTVSMEDEAGPRSPRHEVSRGVQASSLVVSIVTPQYALTAACQRAIDLAQAFGKPVVVVFAGLSSQSALARPYSVHQKIELAEAWDGSERQWQDVLRRINEEVIEARQQRLGTGQLPALEAGTATRVTQAILMYDLEDQRLGHELLRVRPGWRRSDVTSDDPAAQAGLVRILLWTAATSEPNSLVRREYEHATDHSPGFLLSVQGARPVPADALVIPVTEFLPSASHTPVKVKPADEAAQAQVEFLLSQAHGKNYDCPVDVLNDRICCSSEVGDLLREAYELAVAELHESEPLRLKAVYRYALTLRFYGDWRLAVDVIDAELGATHGELPGEGQIMRLRLELEKLVLEYELGDHRARGVRGEVRELQKKFQQLDDLIGYVQGGRVLGNVLRVCGEFESAERVFQRTIGVAEYIAESTDEGGPIRLLVADCHRELAGLYIARHDTRLAAESIADARANLQIRGRAPTPAERYLSAVLDYVDATLAQGNDVVVRATAPIEQVQAALQTLLAFENPIRIAQVYSWLGLSWVRQIPKRQDDLLRGEEYLKKALRIREAHQQRYTCGLSHLNLGELYEALGDLDRSIEHYQESRQIFNARGLPPALARAHAAMARAYARKSIRPGDDASRHSRQQLQLAEHRYREVGLDNEALELRYELQHGGRTPLSDAADETPLIAVGEYLLHEWIRELISSRAVTLAENLQLIVGVGDDAAVVSSGRSRAGWSFVFTTDSAPGSLAVLTKSPEYVGRFAVIQTLADVLAMGARPVALLVNVFLSRAVTVGYVRQAMGAIIEEASKYGVAVIGGDIKERNEQSIGCVGIGFVDDKRILRRDAARPGHALGITLASSPDGGRRLIGARWAQELVEHYRLDATRIVQEFPDLETVLDPNIKSDLLYVPDSVMKSAVRSGELRAAIDTSDGVLACLEILGRESDVGFELDETAIDAIIDERARLLARALDLPPMAFLFSAGHDWEVVFSCDAPRFPAMQDAVRRELDGNGDVARIGTVVAREDTGNGGINLRRADGQLTSLPYYTDEKFVPRSYQDRPSQWLTFATRLRAVPSAKK